MKQTKITTDDKPIVIKDENNSPQLLLNRVDENNKKSYIFGLNITYSVIPESITLKYTNYTDANFLEGDQRINILSFSGITTTKYGSNDIITSTTEFVEVEIIMENPYRDLIGTFVWHGVPIMYNADYGLGTARVLYARQKEDDTFEYTVMKINESIDKQMYNNNWKAIAIHAADYEALEEYGDNNIPVEQRGYDLFVALDAFEIDDYNNITDSEYDPPKLYFGLRKDIPTNQVNVGLNKTASNFYVDVENCVELIKGNEFEAHENSNITSSTITLQIEESEMHILYDGYGLTQTLYGFHTSANSKGSGDTIGTNLEDIKFEKINTCPPAATCVLYKTFGTNQNEWFLPSFAEFFIADKSKERLNRQEIDAAINILINNGRNVEIVDENAYWTSTPIKTSYNNIPNCYGAFISQDHKDIVYSLLISEVRTDSNRIRPFIKIKLSDDKKNVISIFGRNN